jgi:hypothetical protein
MYFWQIGAEMSEQKQDAEPEFAGYSSRQVEVHKRRKLQDPG